MQLCAGEELGTFAERARDLITPMDVSAPATSPRDQQVQKRGVREV